MATKGWKVVQAHVPMIRFRKGGNSRGVMAMMSISILSQALILSITLQVIFWLVAGAASKLVTGSSPINAGSAPSSKVEGATGPNVVVLPIIEDFQLPPRFQRRPIDSKEIEYINRGGPE